MHFQLAPLGPRVGLVVVSDVAEQETPRCLVDDQANITADTHRPEVLVFRLGELVKAHARVGRIYLEVEGRGLDAFLLFARQASEAVSKGIGDAKFHEYVSMPTRLRLVRV